MISAPPGAVGGVWAGRFALAAALVLLAALTAAPVASALRSGVPAPRRTPTDAWVAGTFAMRATVTVAVHVRGEHAGQTLRRRWRLIPSGCAGDVCRRLTLYRNRASGLVERVSLRRTAPGRYAGDGTFYAGLRCLGRRYRLGSRVRFRITLTVTRGVVIQGRRFAQRITATYVNRRRTDDTPCPLGPSHDAARYTGRLVSPLPSPPVARFTTAVTAGTLSVGFTDASSVGAGRVPIETTAWQFGDPASGAEDSSALADPVHQFTAPGSYAVTLEATNADGLTSTVTQTVVVPAPPPAAAANAAITPRRSAAAS